MIREISKHDKIWVDNLHWCPPLQIMMIYAHGTWYHVDQLNTRTR